MRLDKLKVNEELDKALSSGKGASITKIVLSAMGGIPVVGSAFGAAGTAWSEFDQRRFDRVFLSWLHLQEDEIREIGITIAEVMVRIDTTKDEVMRRIESSEYLSLIKKCFRDWGAAESEVKRLLIRNLLVNAAYPNQICADDVIKLFISWIERYSEAHFKIIREVHNNKGITRRGIWDNIHGKIVREDSAEADLFKYLINELSIGRIIRQHREVDYWGNYIRKPPTKKLSPTHLVKSFLDDGEEYELTNLGVSFVHYTMNEEVTKIEEKSRVDREE